MRRTIIGGGNFIVDYVKTIDAFPPEQALANIHQEHTGSGGAPYNVLRSLAILGASDFDLQAIGRIGNDDAGRYILEDCRSHGIDTSRLKTMPGTPTSYTLVMTTENTGKRTFFHQRGANAFLTPEDFHFEQPDGHLHYGYLLLLDSMDEDDAQYGTQAAGVLAQARKAGLTVSVNLVSENSDRFRRTVPPALKHANLVFMNEFEATRLTGIELIEDGVLRADRVSEARARIDCPGILALHWAQGAAACFPDGTISWQGSVRLPEDKIASVVGSGDAFAAGFLLAILRGEPIRDSLKLGVCCAAASVTGYTCTDAILPAADCLALGERYGYCACP